MNKPAPLSRSAPGEALTRRPGLDPEERRQPQSGGRGTRSLSVTPGTYDATSHTVDAILSTGAAVARFYFSEELEISEQAIDLSRVTGGVCPLLDTHNQYELSAQIGRITAARVENGQLVGTIQFDQTEPGQLVEARVARGELRAISIGYQVTTWQITSTPGSSETETWRAMSWQLLEASLVPVPADPAAVIRSAAGPQENTDMRRNLPTNDGQNDPANRRGERQNRGSVVTEDRIRSMCDRGNFSRDFERTLLEDHRFEPYTENQLLRAINDELMGARGGVTIDARQGDGPNGAMRGPGGPDGMARAMEDALFARLSGNAPSEQGREFMGARMIEMARGLMEARGERARWLSPARVVDQMTRAGNHTTSDFPNILGNAARRYLLDILNAYPAPLRPLVKPRTAADFRRISLVKVGVNPALLVVPENGEIKRGTILDAAEGYALQTYARIVGVTRQLLINDDLGAFAAIFQGWGRAAAELEASLIAGLIAGNPNMSDGKPLYSTDHGNLAAAGGPITIANLSTARQAMRMQKDLDNSTFMDAQPKFLVVGAGKQTEAEQVLSTLAAATADNANPFSGKLTLLSAPRLPGNSWRLFADPAAWPVIEVARLEGQEDVFVDSRVGFDVDGVETKARLDIGGAAVDWRGTYMNPGN